MSYDDHQVIDALRLKCSGGCGIEYFFTQNYGYRDKCVDCDKRDRAITPKAVPITERSVMDTQGHVASDP